MIDLNQIPKEAWAVGGVVVGTTLSGAFAFFNARSQRQVERDKILKTWLLDEGIKPVLSHIGLLLKHASEKKASKLREIIEDGVEMPELMIVARRYGTNWAAEYRDIILGISRTLNDDEMANLTAYSAKLNRIQEEVGATYEWQALHLSCYDWRRKRAARKITTRISKTGGSF